MKNLSNITIENLKDSSLHGLMKDVIKHAPIGMAVHDNDLRYLFVSDRYLKDYHVTDENIIGKHHYEVIPNIPEKWKAVHQRVLAGETITGKGDSYLREDGMMEYTQWECKPWYQQDGSIGGMVLYTELVTEKVYLESTIEHQELLFKSAFDATQEGIVIMDTEQNVVRANKTMGQWFSDLQPLTGKKCHEIWRAKASPCEVCVGEQVLESQEACVDEVILQHPEKADTVLEIHTYPMSDPQGQKVGLVKYIRDITHQKQLEKVLIDAKDLAETANRAKDQFLANMSHELRTPLNALYGMLQLLDNTDLTEEQNECVQLALGGSKSMTSVVGDILNYTSLKKGTQKTWDSPFQLDELLNYIKELHQTAAFRKGLHISVDREARLPNELIGDRFKLKQILGNLVGNAIKFTESGTIRLAARQATGNGKAGRINIDFQVQDTGIGIPPEKLDYIFHRFSQVDESHTRKYGGLGLGLAVAREQASILGGTLTAESTPGQGSTFTFTCEMDLLEKTQVPDASHPDSSFHQISPRDVSQQVLVVDDDYASRLLARLCLVRLGYHVEEAVNGQEALDKMANTSYDLIFMDCQMPVMNGYEATRHIREREKSTGLHTPIVAMTAKVLPGDREECLEAGMDIFLPKPVTVERIRELASKPFKSSS